MKLVEVLEVVEAVEVMEMVEVMEDNRGCAGDGGIGGDGHGKVYWMFSTWNASLKASVSLQKVSSSSCSVMLVALEEITLSRLSSTASVGVWVRFKGISCSAFLAASWASRSSCLVGRQMNQTIGQ